MIQPFYYEDYLDLDELKDSWKDLKKLTEEQNVLLGPEDCLEVLQILDLVPKEIKVKKDIPTVIEYQGRRYVLDHGNK